MFGLTVKRGLKWLRKLFIFMFLAFYVLATMFYPHEGHHTGDQSGAARVQLSLKTNGPSGNCLIPSTIPLTLPCPPILLLTPPVCLLDFTC